MKGKTSVIQWVALITILLWGALPALAAETALTTDSYDHIDPEWSADGNWIVYARRDGAGIYDQIYKIAATGGPEIPLTSSLYMHYNPQWSPDGTMVAFSRDGDNVNRHIFTISSGGGPENQLSDCGLGCFAMYPQWSPDGTEITYQKPDSISGYTQIFTVASSGGPENRFTTDSYHHDYPLYSPDGNKMVYIKYDATGYEQIYTIPSVGGTESQLTSSLFPHGIPRWSPDSQYIAYYLENPSGHTELYKIVSTGGAEIQITNDPTNWGSQVPRWSPDGQYVVYQKLLTSPFFWQIYVVGASGGPEQAQTSDNFYHWLPKFSPNGNKMVYFKQDSTGYKQIYVADFTPPPEPLIPALSEYGLFILVILMALTMAYFLGRKRRRQCGRQSGAFL